MAPEVIVCDEQPDATYDNRVSTIHIEKTLNISTMCFIPVIKFIQSKIMNFSPFTIKAVKMNLHKSGQSLFIPTNTSISMTTVCKTLFLYCT